jgi:hypothetical protein
MEEDGGGGGAKVGMLENFMKTHQSSLKSLFQRKKSSSGRDGDASPSPIASPKPIPQLSLLANSVVSRCSKYTLSNPHIIEQFRDSYMIQILGLYLRLHNLYCLEFTRCDYSLLFWSNLGIFFLMDLVFGNCRILNIQTEDLQHHFDVELPESVKQLLTYARNFLEFCSFQALHQVMKKPDYLSDQEFRQLMFDMMLAWETPSVTSEQENKVRNLSNLPCS